MRFLSDGFFFLDYYAGMRFNLVALIMQRVPTLGVGVAARTQATRVAARKPVNLHTSLLDLIRNDSSLFPFPIFFCTKAFSCPPNTGRLHIEQVLAT